jgi:hypothetical protein
MRKMIFGFFAGLMALPLMAGSITLTPSSGVVTTGQLFTVDVIYNFDSGSTDEIVGFGFNVQTNGLVTYQPPPVSLNALCTFATVGLDVAASCFDTLVGITGPTATLATLNFRAGNSAGIGQFFAFGVFDETDDVNANAGIFLLESTDAVNGTNTVRIVQGEEETVVPEPSAAFLLLSTVPAFWLLKRRR